jgi:hypothetical protein
MIFEQHTTARCSLTWARLLARPNYCGHASWICGPYIIGCNSARLYAWLGTCSVATSRETTRHWVLSMFAQLHEYPPSMLRTAVLFCFTYRLIPKPSKCLACTPFIRRDAGAPGYVRPTSAEHNDTHTVIPCTITTRTSSAPYRKSIFVICVCVCVLASISVCICVFAWAFVCVLKGAIVAVPTCVYVSVFLKSMCVSLGVYVSVSFISVCVCVCVCVCF